MRVRRVSEAVPLSCLRKTKSSRSSLTLYFFVNTSDGQAADSSTNMESASSSFPTPLHNRK